MLTKFQAWIIRRQLKKLAKRQAALKNELQSEFDRLASDFFSQNAEMDFLTGHPRLPNTSWPREGKVGPW